MGILDLALCVHFYLVGNSSAGMLTDIGRPLICDSTGLDGFCLFMLIFFFPETSSNTILLKRAKRLRKRTGNENLKSESEIQSSQMTGKDIAMMTVSYIALAYSRIAMY
jgi:hypothetical protein